MSNKESQLKYQLKNLVYTNEVDTFTDLQKEQLYTNLCLTTSRLVLTENNNSITLLLSFFDGEEIGDPGNVQLLELKIMYKNSKIQLKVDKKKSKIFFSMLRFYHEVDVSIKTSY